MVCKEMNDQPNCKENAFEKLRQVLKPYNSFRVTAKTFDVTLGVQAHCPANLDWPRYPAAPLYRSPALSRSRSPALFLAPAIKSPLRFGAQRGA